MCTSLIVEHDPRLRDVTTGWRDRARRGLGLIGRLGGARPGDPPVRRSRARTFTGPPGGRHLDYAPQLDGRADPGEIVWTWVTFEEDATHGKDRPVLVVGREDGTLLGLMLSSQHDRDGQHGWFALGAGPWDRDGRPSWVRLDRVLTVPEDGIRREGAVLDRRRFDAVAARLRSDYGWL
ncbi:MAG TPA: type II toxin-antitoxin system PemK/MazF family toxin [Actinomycetes bacterium]